MKTGHWRDWTARGAAMLAVVTLGCEGLPTEGTNPNRTSDQQVVSVSSALKSSSSRPLDPNTQFFVPPPDSDGVQQVISLRKAHKFADAARISDMLNTPSAVWFTEGTPADVQANVRKTVSSV